MRDGFFVMLFFALSSVSGVVTAIKFVQWWGVKEDYWTALASTFLLIIGFLVGFGMAGYILFPIFRKLVK